MPSQVKIQKHEYNNRAKKTPENPVINCVHHSVEGTKKYKKSKDLGSNPTAPNCVVVITIYSWTFNLVSFMLIIFSRATHICNSFDTRSHWLLDWSGCSHHLVRTMFCASVSFLLTVVYAACLLLTVVYAVVFLFTVIYVVIFLLWFGPKSALGLCLL